MYQDDVNRIATAIVATARGYRVEVDIVAADVMDEVSKKMDTLYDDNTQISLGPWVKT